MNVHEAQSKFAADRAMLAERGVVFMDGTQAYQPDGGFRGAMDAAFKIHGINYDAALATGQPILTTSPNSAIPAMLTTFIDPDILRVVFAPNKATVILGGDGGGERKKGDWTEMTAMFPVIEPTGEVSSYGDYSENGSAGVNFVFPNRQSYHYQTIIQYGERELEMAAKAQIDMASQKKMSSTIALDKFQTQTYFFGVAGLQNYGFLNDPALPASIQPGPKAYNAQAHGPWVTGGVVTATPNEVYTDILSLFNQLVAQSDGVIELDQTSAMVLAMSPTSMTALAQANSFNVSVKALLAENFPNLRIEAAIQYATAAGNLVQMIATDASGQDSGYCAFTEKLRAHAIVRDMSAFKQKVSQGTWGAIVRQPWAFASMLGV